MIRVGGKNGKKLSELKPKAPSDSMWTMSNEIRELVTSKTVSLDSRSDDNQKFNFNRERGFVTKLKNQGKLKLKSS